MKIHTVSIGGRTYVDATDFASYLRATLLELKSSESLSAEQVDTAERLIKVYVKTLENF